MKTVRTIANYYGAYDFSFLSNEANMTKATKQHREDLDRYLATLAPQIHKNIEVVAADEMGRSHLLHISPNTNIDAFVPMMSGRTQDKEDRAVARVCTAPELVSAIMGYSQAITDNIFPSDKKKDHPEWKNGYHIYGLPFEYAIKANKKLLPDVGMTNEHWLVAYNKDTAKYTPVDLGIFFYGDIIIRRGPEFSIGSEVELFIRVDHKDGLWFTPHQQLTKGFWYYKGSDPGNIRNFNGTKTVKAVPIDQSEFTQKKRMVAATLSYTESAVRAQSLLQGWN